MKRLIFIAPVVLFAALILAFALGLRRDPSKLPSVLINQPLPTLNLASVRPGEANLTNTDYRSGPVMLNVFASWCVSCRVEHPLLLRLKNEGVPIDGLDWKDKPADVERYLSESGDPYRRIGADLNGRAAVDLGVTGAPETFIVDRHGRVRYKHIGPIMPEDWTGTLEPLMRKLRDEP